MHLVESPWLKHFGLQLCPQVIFAFQKKNSQEILLELVKKTKKLYVLPCLAKHIFATTSFDLWMSKGAYDISTFVINFLGRDW
jgi:hypothetical protein